MPMAMIKRFLEDINLQVTSGEVVSILGPSGVGKTTLFNLIAGIFRSSVWAELSLDGEENPKGARELYVAKGPALGAQDSAWQYHSAPLDSKGG